jgi:MFS transporter, putative metabolite:H+ symporter
MKNPINKINSPWIPVIAVALGYYVDLYDLLLFSSVRIASLAELNITGEQSTYYATNLLNLTVYGMVAGGFFWGILADKKGRLSVLFASIATYTLANFFNAFIQDIHLYQICRFVAGFGLAGELGVGIALVSEALESRSKEEPEWVDEFGDEILSEDSPREGRSRTIATAIITASGMLGAVTAGLLGYNLKGIEILGLSSWRFLFLLGGILGTLLLIFRFSISESALFENQIKEDEFSEEYEFSEDQVEKKNLGNFKLIISSKERFKRYAYCILCGTPVFFIVGVFISLSPEWGKEFGLLGIEPSIAIACCYLAISVADFFGTLLSKRMKSRKKVLYTFLSVQLISVLVFLFIPYYNNIDFYLRCSFIGIGIGYWGVMILNGVEQFGTNLRATVATTLPNLVRGALPLLSTFLFMPLKIQVGMQWSAATIASSLIIIAGISVS